MTDEKKKPEEDEVSDEQLDGVAGGATVFANAAMGGPESGAIPPAMGTPSPGGSVVPIPYPNTAGGDISNGDVPKTDSPINLQDKT